MSFLNQGRIYISQESNSMSRALLFSKVETGLLSQCFKTVNTEDNSPGPEGSLLYSQSAVSCEIQVRSYRKNLAKVKVLNKCKGICRQIHFFIFGFYYAAQELVSFFSQVALGNILSEDIVPGHSVCSKGVFPHYIQQVCFFIFERTICTLLFSSM